MSDTWQPPYSEGPLDQHVEQIQNSMARPIAELTKLIGELRADADTLTDFLPFRNDTTSNGAIETTARALTDKMKLLGLLLVTPVGTTACTLQIGEILLPVQNTSFCLTNLARQVQPQDRIRVTLTPDGPVTLWLWGTVIPVASV